MVLIARFIGSIDTIIAAHCVCIYVWCRICVCADHLSSLKNDSVTWDEQDQKIRFITSISRVELEEAILEITKDTKLDVTNRNEASSCDNNLGYCGEKMMKY